LTHPGADDHLRVHGHGGRRWRGSGTTSRVWVWHLGWDFGSKEWNVGGAICSYTM
jgi:hypothetical protein